MFAKIPLGEGGERNPISAHRLVEVYFHIINLLFFMRITEIVKITSEVSDGVLLL